MGDELWQVREKVDSYYRECLCTGLSRIHELDVIHPLEGLS